MESITDTLRTSAATIKPTLAAFPLEILMEIAGYVAQDSTVLPETQQALQYTTNSEESQQYWPWISWTAKERLKISYIFLHTLSLTCSRIFQACENALYRNAIVSSTNHRQLHKFLDTVTKENNTHLQRYVVHMAITYAFGRKFGHHTSRKSQETQTSLSSEALKMHTLRSLELTQKNGHLLYHLDSWHMLLPTLPLLQRLTLRGFCKVDVNFPTLPRLKEAYFYEYSFSDSENTIKLLLEKFPSLHALVSFNNFDKVSRDAFEPVKDTLETLAWADTAQEYPTALIPNISCLRKLRHLKTGFIASQYENSRSGVLFWNGNILAEMESLETVEMVVSQDDQRFLRVDQGVELRMAMRKILGTFGGMKMGGGVKSLRVVDMRCFNEWTDDIFPWKMMREEFLNAAMRRFEKLGIALLLPETATRGFSIIA
ncbi:hypothetical protein CI238_05640 [Colletotrichum incanum]|uniref:F-box domain-containing protein n=1 Tax=Colletotrichum incanum TaxID=1573173 RepID=A0A161YA73_COLIC|nr:hypothetical protein CI238_05640 [Colletotrichum incanum]